MLYRRRNSSNLPWTSWHEERDSQNHRNSEGAPPRFSCVSKPQRQQMSWINTVSFKCQRKNISTSQMQEDHSLGSHKIITNYPMTLKWVRVLPYHPEMSQSLILWPWNGSESWKHVWSHKAQHRWWLCWVSNFPFKLHPRKRKHSLF